MAKGQCTIVSEQPKGKFIEGIVSGTPKPGTVMQPTNAALQAGRQTWIAWTKATGAYGLVTVLLGDVLQGKLEVGAAVTGAGNAAGDAYVSGTRCFLYQPAAGEELNMIVEDVSGTTDDIAIGDLFAIKTTSGKLIANSSNAFPCFTSMEVITDPIADTVVCMQFNG